MRLEQNGVASLWRRWFWPTLIGLSALAVGLVTLVFPGAALRPALVMWFLFVCPGMIVVRFFRLAEFAVEWTLALALSCAIDACIAGMLLYAGWWSPMRILEILIGFCLLTAIIQPLDIDLSPVLLKLKPRWIRRLKPSWMRKLKPRWIVPSKRQNGLKDALQASSEDVKEG